jgi:hypothetical protein
VETPPPDLMAQARRFTIAFAAIAIFGLVVGVAFPFVVPGPKPVTVAIGSCCFVLILIVGAKVLRRRLIRSTDQRG